MKRVTLADAYQEILDTSLASALQQQGMNPESALDVARVTNGGSARTALEKKGINPDQMVTMDERGQCVAACGYVLIPAPNNGPTPGRKSAGLARVFGGGQVVTDDATPNSEYERANRYINHLGNG